MCWNNVTKWERLALDKNADSMLLLSNTSRTTQHQLMYKFEILSKGEQRIKTSDLCQLHSGWNQGVDTKIEAIFYFSTMYLSINVQFYNVFVFFVYMFFSIFFFFNLKVSWNIGFSRNIFLSLRNKSKVFCVGLHYELKKVSLYGSWSFEFSQNWYTWHWVQFFRTKVGYS